MFSIPGKIPILIRPTFWVTAAFIGYFSSQTLIGTLIWMGIIFVSVLFHEFGHAVAALMFGKKPRIELVAMGGLTYHDSEDLPRWKQFLITFNGPFFGFLLFVMGCLILPFVQEPTAKAILLNLVNVNLFWTVLNLLPVFPLDGGQLLRIICEALFGSRGLRYALCTSIVVGVGLSLLLFLAQQFLVGALFFLLAFQSFDAWRQSRTLSDVDRSAPVKLAFEEGEKALQEGRKEEALTCFEKVRQQSRQGMFNTLATQYIAFLKYDKGETKTCYDLLKPLEKALSSDALCLLHRVAFDEKDYALVAKLAGSCFQVWPSAEMALRNATACAHLTQAGAAVGWLQTAVTEGLENLKEVIADTCFDPIRNTPAFRDFLNNSR